MLSLINLNVGFDNSIINDVNLSLPSGKIVFLLARNGHGKSCLLKTIGGLISPLNGKIFIDEVDLNNLNINEKAKKISLLTTDKINTDFLKVHDLISLSRSPFTNWIGQLTAEDKKIIDENIKIFELESLLNKDFIELSDGQKQKVMLCKSLSQTPKILLLDEPTTFLDISSKVEFLNKLKEVVKNKNLSAIITTHDLTLIKEIADEIWYIENNFLKIERPDVFFNSGLLNKLFGLDLG